jgi:hypothetical protein
MAGEYRNERDPVAAELRRMARKFRRWQGEYERLRSFSPSVRAQLFGSMLTAREAGDECEARAARIERAGRARR